MQSQQQLWRLFFGLLCAMIVNGQYSCSASNCVYASTVDSRVTFDMTTTESSPLLSFPSTPSQTMSVSTATGSTMLSICSNSNASVPISIMEVHPEHQFCHGRVEHQQWWCTAVPIHHQHLK